MTYPTSSVNITDFVWFIQNVMKVPSSALPTSGLTTYADITTAYAVALETVDIYILNISPLYYNLAVYNFAGDYLINWAQDLPSPSCSTFFADTRAQWNITGFKAGVVQSSADEGTSTSLSVAPAQTDLTLFDLQMLKTPYGRTYMAIAQKFGDVWGIT